MEAYGYSVFQSQNLNIWVLCYGCGLCKKEIIKLSGYQSMNTKKDKLFLNMYIYIYIS